MGRGVNWTKRINNKKGEEYNESKNYKWFI